MDQPPAKRPKIYIVNLQWTPKDDVAALKINGQCDIVMEKVMKVLGLKIPPYTEESDPIFYLHTALKEGEEDTTQKKILKVPENLAPPKWVYLRSRRGRKQKVEKNLRSSRKRKRDDNPPTKATKIKKDSDSVGVDTEEVQLPNACLPTSPDHTYAQSSSPRSIGYQQSASPRSLSPRSVSYPQSTSPRSVSYPPSNSPRSVSYSQSNSPRSVSYSQSSSPRSVSNPQSNSPRSIGQPQSSSQISASHTHANLPKHVDYPQSCSPKSASHTWPNSPKPDRGLSTLSMLIDEVVKQQSNSASLASKPQSCSLKSASHTHVNLPKHVDHPQSCSPKSASQTCPNSSKADEGQSSLSMLIDEVVTKFADEDESPNLDAYIENSDEYISSLNAAQEQRAKAASRITAEEFLRSRSTQVQGNWVNATSGASAEENIAKVASGLNVDEQFQTTRWLLNQPPLYNVYSQGLTASLGSPGAKYSTILPPTSNLGYTQRVFKRGLGPVDVLPYPLQCLQQMSTRDSMMVQPSQSGATQSTSVPAKSVTSPHPVPSVPPTTSTSAIVKTEPGDTPATASCSEMSSKYPILSGFIKIAEEEQVTQSEDIQPQEECVSNHQRVESTAILQQDIPVFTNSSNMRVTPLSSIHPNVTGQTQFVRATKESDSAIQDVPVSCEVPNSHAVRQRLFHHIKRRSSQQLISSGDSPMSSPEPYSPSLSIASQPNQNRFVYTTACSTAAGSEFSPVHQTFAQLPGAGANQGTILPAATAPSIAGLPVAAADLPVATSIYSVFNPPHLMKYGPRIIPVLSQPAVSTVSSVAGQPIVCTSEQPSFSAALSMDSQTSMNDDRGQTMSMAEIKVKQPFVSTEQTAAIQLPVSTEQGTSVSWGADECSAQQGIVNPQPAFSTVPIKTEQLFVPTEATPTSVYTRYDAYGHPTVDEKIIEVLQKNMQWGPELQPSLFTDQINTEQTPFSTAEHVSRQPLHVFPSYPNISQASLVSAGSRTDATWQQPINVEGFSGIPNYSQMASGENRPLTLHKLAKNAICKQYWQTPFSAAQFSAVAQNFLPSYKNVIQQPLPPPDQVMKTSSSTAQNVAPQPSHSDYQHLCYRQITEKNILSAQSKTDVIGDQPLSLEDFSGKSNYSDMDSRENKPITLFKLAETLISNQYCVGQDISGLEESVSTSLPSESNVRNSTVMESDMKNGLGINSENSALPVTATNQSKSQNTGEKLIQGKGEVPTCRYSESPKCSTAGDKPTLESDNSGSAKLEISGVLEEERQRKLDSHSSASSDCSEQKLSVDVDESSKSSTGSEESKSTKEKKVPSIPGWFGKGLKKYKKKR